MKKMTVLFFVLKFAFSTCASAEQLAVAISDDTGMLVFCDAALEVSDVDGDGNLTVYDALYAAHEMGYDGGAAAGLDTGDFGYGLSLTKLWGVDNGGSYGYYVNDMAAMSLDDAVFDGAYVRAYAYTDLENWSDTYACFDVHAASATAGEALQLSLCAIDWNGGSVPVVGAEILVNGEASGILTGENGEAEITFEQAGNYIISARTDAFAMVAPVCFVSVE